jgi:hypothetical protein
MKTSIIITKIIDFEVKAPDGYYILDNNDLIKQDDLVYNKLNTIGWVRTNQFSMGGLVSYYKDYIFARKIDLGINMEEYLKKQFIGKECFYKPCTVTFPCIIKNIHLSMNNHIFCDIENNDGISTCTWRNVLLNNIKMKE